MRYSSHLLASMLANANQPPDVMEAPSGGQGGQTMQTIWSPEAIQGEVMQRMKAIDPLNKGATNANVMLAAINGVQRDFMPTPEQRAMDMRQQMAAAEHQRQMEQLRLKGTTELQKQGGQTLAEFVGAHSAQGRPVPIELLPAIQQQFQMPHPGMIYSDPRQAGGSRLEMQGPGPSLQEAAEKMNQAAAARAKVGSILQGLGLTMDEKAGRAVAGPDFKFNEDKVGKLAELMAANQLDEASHRELMRHLGPVVGGQDKLESAAVKEMLKNYVQGQGGLEPDLWGTKKGSGSIGGLDITSEHKGGLFGGEHGYAVNVQGGPGRYQPFSSFELSPPFWGADSEKQAEQARRAEALAPLVKMLLMNR